jgi:hypothetical protein
VASYSGNFGSGGGRAFKFPAYGRAAASEWIQTVRVWHRLAAVVRDRWPPVQIIVTSGYLAKKDITIPAQSLFFAKPYSAQAVTAALQHMVR